MKKKVLALLALVSLIMLVAPLVNFSSGKSKHWSDWQESELYNLDFVLPVLGGFYYLLGISIAPEQVVIGKEGWLYLGDVYGGSITNKRIGVTPQDEVVAAKVMGAAAVWDKWFKHHGVKEYRIIIGPDKDTVYPEFLPDWAKPSSNPTFDALVNKADSKLFVNGLGALREAKQKYDVPLYFKTDHHWNGLGGWLAFNELAESLSRARPDLIFPSVEVSDHPKVVPWAGGDLAKFQRVRSLLKDQYVEMDMFASLPIEQYDFNSGRLISVGSNLELGAPDKPLMVKSVKALNNKKVLWLRDSFGSVMSPYMMATFSDVLQMHYGVANSEFYSHIFEKFNPDYVIVTVAERNSRIDYFQAFPPLSLSRPKETFVSHTRGEVVAKKDITVMEGDGAYRTAGENPYLVFKLQKPIKAKLSEQLVVDLKCDNGTDQVPVQMFWRTNNSDFSEDRRFRFIAYQGLTSVNLSSAASWVESEDVTAVRIDFESPGGCSKLTVGPLKLGINKL